MITMKFGGTSVQDAEAIANVVGIVRSSLPRKPVVVISAIAQGTNALEKIGGRRGEHRGVEGRDRRAAPPAHHDRQPPDQT
jgi:aspartokinase